MNFPTFYEWFQLQDSNIKTPEYARALYNAYCKAKGARERILFPFFNRMERRDDVFKMMREDVYEYVTLRPRSKESKAMKAASLD